MSINEARSHGFHDAVDGGDRFRWVPDSLRKAYDEGFKNGEYEREWLDENPA